MSQDRIRAWCPDHWKAFQDGHRNALLATCFLLEEAVNHVPLMLEARAMYGRPSGAIPPDVMNTVFMRHAPLCCYLGAAVLDAVLRRTAAQ